MAYGDEKVAINLRDGEEYGALIEMGADEKERTYYPKQFAIHWNCEKLQVRQGFAYREESDQNFPRMLTYITGVARLVSDYSVSVIGEPKNTTTTVELSFQPDDSPDLLKENESGSEEPRFRLLRSYGRAHMGFNRADWELQTSDQWWLECRLRVKPPAPTPPTMRVRSGRIDKSARSTKSFPSWCSPALCTTGLSC